MIQSSTAILYQVYKTINIKNGMFYVGIHVCHCKRCRYLGSGRDLIKAIKEYGKENFKKEIIFLGKSKKEIEKKEKEIVNEDFINRNETYNVSLGGAFNQTGLIQVKDKNGNNLKIRKDDPRYLNELQPVSKNFIVVRDKNNNILRVKTSDKRYLSGELEATLKGKVMVKDKNGNTLQVSKDHKDYLNGTLVSISKDMVTAKDIHGKFFKVHINDKRLGKTLFGIAKGKVSVKDKNGNKFCVSKDDTRYLSGELVGVNNRKRYMNNGKQNKMVNFDEINKYLQLGFKLGYLFTKKISNKTNDIYCILFCIVSYFLIYSSSY